MGHSKVALPRSHFGHHEDRSPTHGYALANKGHDTRALQAYLGHRSIQHTVRYTQLAPDRFKGFWKDLSHDPNDTRLRHRSAAAHADVAGART
jgi:site-specific recombinase XerC